MSDTENIFNDDEFFGDTIDKPSEDIEQHENRKCLQNVLSKARSLRNSQGMFLYKI